MIGLFSAPPLEDDTIIPYPHQGDAFEAVQSEFRRGIKRTAVIHPMGSGKTTVMAKIARACVEKRNRVLVLAHLGELITQTANVIERVGVMPAIEKAETDARHLFDPDVVVGSVQTMRGERLASWAPDYFKLILIDECHHSTCESYQAIVRRFPGARVAGFTATPDRADGTRIDDFFETVAHELTIWDLVYAPHPGPYLCEPVFMQADVSVDLRKLRPGRHDYSSADLERRIAPLAKELGKATRKEAGDRPTMVFTPGVVSATALAAAIRSRGAIAEWVSGDDPARDDKIAAYKEGDIQFLVSCQLLLEGFDCPRTACVSLCQPTNSRARMAQMIGRALRLFRGKRDALIIDFDYLTATHSLVRPAHLFADILGSPLFVEDASNDIALSHGLSLAEVIERSKTRRATPRGTRREIEVRADDGEVYYRKQVCYRPGINEAPESPPRAVLNARHDIPSEKMVGFLKARGHARAANYSRRYAGKLIGMYKAKEAADSATQDREAV